MSDQEVDIRDFDWSDGAYCDASPGDLCAPCVFDDACREIHIFWEFVEVDECLLPLDGKSFDYFSRLGPGNHSFGMEFHGFFVRTEDLGY